MGEGALQALLRNPAYWRDRAEEVRTIAEQLTDDGAKAAMMRVAVDCDRLAEHAARQAESEDL
jgi:hypothetical protein